MTETISAKDLAELADKYLMPNYGSRATAIVEGEGTWCRDAEGREYLDFLGGIAVNNVGHRHPAVVEAIRLQSEKLLHCSNAFLIEPQIRLAERLCRQTRLARALFANSGTEATEAGIKLARRWSENTHGPGHATVIAFRSSFHGRTYGAMSATWSPKVRKGFGPLVPGIRFADLNDLASVEAVWDDDVCAVLVETVQGEGGVIPCERDFLVGLRELCTERGALLISDEIQCGMGRTGYAMAYQSAEIEPDVLLIAKALGGGLPLGAVLAGPKVCDTLQPGSHGSTFGGNPVACAAGLAVCDIVFDADFLADVGRKGCAWWGILAAIQADFPELVEGIRGLGLMQGMVLKVAGADLPIIGRKHGLLFNCTADRVLRFLPPLTVTDEEMHEAGNRLRAAFEEFRAAGHGDNAPRPT